MLGQLVSPSKYDNVNDLKPSFHKEKNSVKPASCLQHHVKRHDQGTAALETPRAGPQRHIHTLSWNPNLSQSTYCISVITDTTFLGAVRTALSPGLRSSFPGRGYTPTRFFSGQKLEFTFPLNPLGSSSVWIDIEDTTVTSCV